MLLKKMLSTDAEKRMMLETAFELKAAAKKPATEKALLGAVGVKPDAKMKALLKTMVKSGMLAKSGGLYCAA